MPVSELTTEERRLELVLRILSVSFLGMALGYLAQGFFAEAEFPFVANSAAKDGIFAMLCFVAAGDVRRNGWAVGAVIGAHLILIGSLLAMALFGDISSVAGSFEGPPGIELPAAETLWATWLCLAIFVTGLLIWMYTKASRARYGLRYLAAHQHRTVRALSEVLVMGEDELLTAEEVAGNVDAYLDSFAAREKWKSKLALSALTVYPMLRGRPPYPLMSPQRRLEFIERCFLRDVAERRLPEPLRRPIQAMLFAAQQLVFIGYYADPRVAEACGYKRFSDRPRFAKSMEKVADREPLDVRTPNEIDTEQMDADVVIVGSGAAGALIAHRLAERGREVVVLERGRHVDPSEFTEDERIQFSNLYADGALQMSKDARFSVLQGMCVGGTTVVNNAVCFDLPAPVLDRWLDPDGLEAGLDEGELAKAFKRVRKFLPVTSQETNPHPGPGSAKFIDGARKLGLDKPGTLSVVEANISDCLGCGYCNYGCPYGKKLSALDRILPAAQKLPKGDVRILAECEAERIEMSGDTASEVRCRLSNGRRLDVRAKTVVVSAGALASSLLLQRSGLGGKLAGRNLGFNLGAPMTGEFPAKINGYDGLQISHFLQPAADDSLILETWFNPLGAQAMFMPGWFTDHYENMRRYDHMACAGSVVGTERNATVKTGFRGRGMKLDYTPTEGDLRRLVGGLETIGRIYLAAGATKVMPTTFAYMPITTESELSRLSAEIRDNTDVQLHSSHPQGGNPVSADPKKGVVDPTFKVYGTENVHLCDASVFPCPITVNPQLTVMALAECAAANIP